jgi:superfamily II DNA or RNA helicase
LTDLTSLKPGTVIRNRSRLWRVEAVDGQILTATSIDGGDAEQRRFFVPLEQITSGRLPPPDTDRVGYPGPQELLVRAYRFGMLHSSAPLLSLQRGSVIPTNYQLVPVVMALDMPRVRLLIADDVGLGKTIEAGLVITELVARQRVRRMLVVVPANLREQWQEALRDFFHLDALIISERHRRALERELPAGANPWEHYRCLITSIDYAKQSVVRNLILEQRWDLVLVDEAHNAARPHSQGDQTVDMERWRFVDDLAKRTEHLLLLTATPHNGYTDSFASLVRMVSEDAVVGPPESPEIVRSIAARHICQRRRRDVESWFESDGRKSPFPQRDKASEQEVISSLNSHEQEAIRAVREYGELVLATSGERKKTRVLASWTVLHLHKRALSSPAALRQSLVNRRAVLERRIKELSPSEDEEETLPVAVARANALDEDIGERYTEEEAVARVERSVFAVKKEDLEREICLVEVALAKAKLVTPERDSKLKKLLDVVLPSLLGESPKVIVFTRYKDTLDYLVNRIRQRPALGAVFAMHGDLSEGQRHEEFGKFHRSSRGVLIATDVLSEGVNLQHACCQVVHYELPWNPNRLEQRNGRVDRYGQPEPIVRIRTLVMNEPLDAVILKVLVQKAYRIRNDYGFAPPFFGDDASVLELIRRQGVSLQLPAGQQLGLFDLPPDVGEIAADAVDPFDDEVLRRIEGECFYGQTHINLPDVQERLRQTEESVGTAAALREFVNAGLERFGCSISENADGTFRVNIPEPALQTVRTGDVIPRATFDPRRLSEDPDIQLINLGHPLVRRIIRAVKERAFLPGPIYGRTSYRLTSAASEVTGLLQVLARYLVHSQPPQIVEDLVPVGMPVYGSDALPAADVERLVTAAPEAGQRPDLDVVEDLRALLGRTDLQAAVDLAVEERRQALALARRELREKLQASGGSSELAWLEGMDNITTASTDVLTATIISPR